MVESVRNNGVLDFVFGSGTTDKVNDFLENAYSQTRDFFSELFPKLTFENDTFNSALDYLNEFRSNLWGDLWGSVAKVPEKTTTTKSNYTEKANEARNYIIGFTSPKSFTEWLSEIGLSNDENSEKYYGNYFKEASESLLKSAYSDKEYNVLKAQKDRFAQNLAAGNAYNISQSDFNSKAQTLYKKGLKNSGFDSYLKGIAYLSYRDEIAKNNAKYADSVLEYEKAYADKQAEIKADTSEKIANRSEELLKLYKSESEYNKGLIRSLT